MNENNGTKKSIFKKWWFWLIIVVAVITVAGSPSGNQTNQNSDSVNSSSATTAATQEKTSSKITMEEFQQLKNGITYDEAVKIIGSEGTLSSEVGIEGEQFHTITYTWEGDKLASSAIITFQEGKLSGKTQIGLE